MAIPVASRAIYLNCAFKFRILEMAIPVRLNSTILPISPSSKSPRKSRKPTICPPTWMAASVTCWHRSTSPPIVRRWHGSELHAARAVRAAAGADISEPESIHQRGDRRSDYPFRRSVGSARQSLHRNHRDLAENLGLMWSSPRVTTASIRSTDFSKRWMRPAATVAKISYTKSTRPAEIYDGGKALSKYVKFLGTGDGKDLAKSVVAW